MVSHVNELHAGLVGERVVVRRVIPHESAPSGRPALTDVLGILEAWGERSITVRREDGHPVTVQLTDIVAGKPIPPRPARRPRPAAGGG